MVWFCQLKTNPVTLSLFSHHHGTGPSCLTSIWSGAGFLWLQSVPVCCAAERLATVAPLFIESLPYFHSLLFKVIIYNHISGIIYQTNLTNLIVCFKNRECSALAFVSRLACYSRFHSRFYSRLLLFSFFLTPFFTSLSNNSGKW